MRITKKKIAVVVAATTVVALGAGSAYAYFTSTGTGNGQASVGANTPWTVAVDTTTVDGPLFPGGAPQHFNYTVTNSGGATQFLHLVDAVINPTGITGCDPLWFTVTLAGDPAGEYGPGQVNHGVATVTMTESHTDQSNCAGAGPTFTLTAS